MENQVVVSHFEVLVDELLKTQPNETLVKQYMEKLGMEYTGQSVQRIGMVLEKMNALVFESKNGKDSNDLPKHP